MTTLNIRANKSSQHMETHDQNSTIYVTSPISIRNFTFISSYEDSLKTKDKAYKTFNIYGHFNKGI